MGKNTIADRLRALAADDQNRSKAARVREVIDEIETALAAGVSRQKVLEALVADGLVMTMRTFETILKRIRRTKGGKKMRATATPPRVKEKPTGVEPPEQETEASVTGSHDPKDIDDIVRSTPDLDALAKLAKRSKKP